MKRVTYIGIRHFFLIISTVYSECKMEKRNSQLKHGQQIEQTRGLFCTCDSGVASCQSQHQYHFWRLSSMFEAYCTGKRAWQMSIHEAMNYKDSLKDCFENVNMYTYISYIACDTAFYAIILIQKTVIWDVLFHMPGM